MTKTDERPTPDDGEGGICNVCGGGVRYGNRHSTCGAAVMRLERERDEARAQRDAAAVANCPALCIQFCAAYQEHRSVARLEAERDQLRVMWERDSKALGVALGHRDTARAVAEDNRALWSQCSQACATLQGERDALREALRELNEATDAQFPAYDFGAQAQAAWGNRIYNARQRARALLDRETT